MYQGIYKMYKYVSNVIFFQMSNNHMSPSFPSPSLKITDYTITQIFLTAGHKMFPTSL